MTDTDQKPGQDLVPANTDVAPPATAKSSAITIAADGKGGVKISLAADKPVKADDKKKMPRGSTVFRHA
ncbi:MAG TPA: hypothetical protein VN154_09355 [Rhizomicrobium sp.]|nr:hypothetical protein [Rhizomicrobium sp.]